MAERFLCASDSSSGGRAIRVWVRILVKALVSLSKTLKSGCIRLASLFRPHDAHLSGPLTRANRTITHPLVVTLCISGQPQVTHFTSMALAADQGEPLELRQSYSNVHVPRPDRVNPWKLIKRTIWLLPPSSTPTRVAHNRLYTPKELRKIKGMFWPNDHGTNVKGIETVCALKEFVINLLL